MCNNNENRLRSIIEKLELNIDKSISDIKNDDLIYLDISSLSYIILITSIENEFGFEFDDEDLEIYKFKTINDFLDYIDIKLKQKE